MVVHWSREYSGYRPWCPVPNETQINTSPDETADEEWISYLDDRIRERLQFLRNTSAEDRSTLHDIWCTFALLD